ncbi:hypothetical protein [Rathayibacter sp. VKM Ac-2857]|uniref:hypothetical protein n=1 Tax=Rathayibacter sp. VKM Ac-2857 TaxID=2739020 RepID=UPI001566C32B|nr:hypothetical protein [Rathayibacter sp. VKM Ac-2857]NQX18323.1 hypothetical protein [Rathayibacter sp. VKM Ac-2857]
MLIVGLGVPLAVVGTRSPEGSLDRSDTGIDIDRGLNQLTAPRNVVAEISWDASTAFDLDLYLGAA